MDQKKAKKAIGRKNMAPSQSTCALVVRGSKFRCAESKINLRGTGPICHATFAGKFTESLQDKNVHKERAKATGAGSARKKTKESQDRAKKLNARTRSGVLALQAEKNQNVFANEGKRKDPTGEQTYNLGRPLGQGNRRNRPRRMIGLVKRGYAGIR